MDVQFDISSIYFGLQTLKDLEEQFISLSSALNGVSISCSVLSTASLFETARQDINNATNSTIHNLITLLEESKNILEKHDRDAALLFKYYEEGILTEDGKWTAVPLMNQDDYGDIKYSGGTVKSSGCGLTSLCMVASYILGQLYTPDDLAAIANENRESNVGKMTTAADYVGVNWVKDPNTSRDDLVNYLNDGKMVICLVKGSSHFVVCTGVGENGQILVNDPYSPFRQTSHQDGYDWSELQFSAGQTWVFDPAQSTGSTVVNDKVSVDQTVLDEMSQLGIDLDAMNDVVPQTATEPVQTASEEPTTLTTRSATTTLSAAPASAGETESPASTDTDNPHGLTPEEIVEYNKTQARLRNQTLKEEMYHSNTNNQGNNSGNAGVNKDTTTTSPSQEQIKEQSRDRNQTLKEEMYHSNQTSSNSGGGSQPTSINKGQTSSGGSPSTTQNTGSTIKPSTSPTPTPSKPQSTTPQQTTPSNTTPSNTTPSNTTPNTGSNQSQVELIVPSNKPEQPSGGTPGGGEQQSQVELIVPSNKPEQPNEIPKPTEPELIIPEQEKPTYQPEVEIPKTDEPTITNEPEVNVPQIEEIIHQEKTEIQTIPGSTINEESYNNDPILGTLETNIQSNQGISNYNETPGIIENGQNSGKAITEYKESNNNSIITEDSTSSEESILNTDYSINSIVDSSTLADRDLNIEQPTNLFDTKVEPLDLSIVQNQLLAAEEQKNRVNTSWIPGALSVASVAAAGVATAGLINKKRKEDEEKEEE